MNRIWNYISYLGLEDREKNLLKRTIILTNQLNFVMLVTMIVLSITVIARSKIDVGPMEMGSFRVFIQLFIHIIIILLSYNRLFFLSKISLAFLPPFILIYMPALTGFVEIESFFYYPVAIIGLSLIPHLIFIPKQSNYVYLISLSYYFLLLIFLLRTMIYFAPAKFEVIDIIQKFRFYYVFIPMIAYAFIHMAIYYLRRLNIYFEKDILDYTRQLNDTIQRLKTTQQQLIQSEKMASLGTLTAGVAHEINNPLNYINGGLQILEDITEQVDNSHNTTLKERYQIAKDMIASGVERTSNIITALMTFSYQGTSELMETDLSALINNTLLFLRSRTKKDIHIRKEFGLKEKVPVFKEKLHQVLLNIIDNALYALQDVRDNNQKMLTIETYKEENYAVIRVSNNGPQIPGDILKQIFDPFFTTKYPGEGTGLGLSVAYSLVQDHKGEIYAENKDDGVSLAIKIPIKSPAV